MLFSQCFFTFFIIIFLFYCYLQNPCNLSFFSVYLLFLSIFFRNKFESFLDFRQTLKNRGFWWKNDETSDIDFKDNLSF
jgi:hypothetical protein